MAEYIEREKAIQQMADNFRQASVDGCDNQFYQVAEDTLTELPAADVAPVVHGEWVKDEEKDMKHCSCCGYRVYFTHNYCPNCGAKMDEGKHEKE